MELSPSFRQPVHVLVATGWAGMQHRSAGWAGVRKQHLLHADEELHLLDARVPFLRPAFATHLSGVGVGSNNV